MLCCQTKWSDGGVGELLQSIGGLATGGATVAPARSLRQVGLLKRNETRGNWLSTKTALNLVAEEAPDQARRASLPPRAAWAPSEARWDVGRDAGRSIALRLASV